MAAGRSALRGDRQGFRRALRHPHPTAAHFHLRGRGSELAIVAENGVWRLKLATRASNGRATLYYEIAT